MRGKTGQRRGLRDEAKALPWLEFRSGSERRQLPPAQRASELIELHCNSH
jgi:hypothetical protein